jgi:hypothetical protein
MRRDYIPAAELAFNAWQQNFVTRVQAGGAGWGLTPVEIAALVAAQVPWDSAYAVGNIEADPSPSQRQAKRDAMRVFKQFIRNFVKTKLNNNTAVVNADREALNLTVYDTERTDRPVPAYAPFVRVDSISHLGHKLRITDPNTPDSQAKPKNAIGMRVYWYIGTVAPTDIVQYQFHGIATRFLYNISFAASDIGKTAWYIVMYEGARGQKGAQSTPADAVII